MSLFSIAATAVAGGVLMAAPAAKRTGVALYDGYLDYDQVRRQCRSMDRGSTRIGLEVYGTSREGRELMVLVLTDDRRHAGDRPALLLTAGLDGRHRVGTGTALRVGERLAAQHADLLEHTTVYIVPLANPDGAQRFLALPSDNGRTSRPVDEDRDGRIDEDGPGDLNGDGVVTMMRRLEPTLDDPPTHLADPAEPRLLRTPDATEGQRAVFSVYTEGVDADGDGLVAEDDEGGVDLDSNFPHEYPEYGSRAGPYQLSEPEALALARFVIDHPNIVVALTYGVHDNLVNVPDGKGKDVTGEGPKVLHEDDVALYKAIGELFTETTGQKRAAGRDPAGSFHAWLYAHRGIPSFATVVWGRPDLPEPEEDASGDEASEGDERGEKDEDAPEPADAEAANWLEYFDTARGGKGFVSWTPFDHPALGPVEIGGFVPGARMNPSADELDDLAEPHARFVVELIGRRAGLAEPQVEVKRLAEGLYELHLGLVNEGFMPTATVMAEQARSIRPVVVRLATPLERIVAGDRIGRVWRIGGSGDRAVEHWIVRGEDGSAVTIEIVDPRFGDRQVTVTLEEE